MAEHVSGVCPGVAGAPLNPASDPAARAKLLDALRAGQSVTAAAAGAGYSRTHVYKVARSDGDVRAAIAALEGGRGRARKAPTPGQIEQAKPQDPLGLSLAERSLEAVARLGIILRADPDGEVLTAADQVRAAKVVLDLVRAPAKANVVTARTLGPGGASSIEATSTMTSEQRQALAEKMFGSA